MTEILEKWDLTQLAGIFRQAGSIALGYYDNPPAELKDDLTVVTAADKEIEKLFTRYCDHPDKGLYLIGEETSAQHSEEYIQQALQSDCCWVLDPIDGTAPYSAHFPVWGISLGLMKKGRIIEGAVYLPVQDVLFITDGSKNMTCSLRNASEFTAITPRSCELGLHGHIAIGQAIAHDWGYSAKNQLFALCSCVGACQWLLDGRITAYCGTFKIWDMAGTLPILANAAFSVVSLSAPGKKISLDLADGDFTLEPGKDRWRIKSPVIIASEHSTVLSLYKNFYKLNP
jgi:myo-inositol-1(or 4)-monophosphatase